MTLSTWTWAIAAVPLLVWGLTVLNLFLWPRGRRDAAARARLPRTAILIPARNEADNIEACVRAACATGLDVVVCDDASTDATPEILARLAATLPNLRVIRGDGVLPRGWCGKPAACARLVDDVVRRGAADAYFFIDADVVLADGAIDRLSDLALDYGADVVTAVPRQVTGTWVEQLILPMLHVTYVSWLPLPLVWRTHDPRFLCANGQLLWITRDTLDAVGGFAAVKSEIVDDMALCRLVKRAHRRVLFADGHALARCRMYRSGKEVVAGFSKNLFEGVGSVAGVVVVLALYAAAFVVPVVAVPFAPLPAAVGVACALSARLALAVRQRQPLWSAVLFPLGALGLMFIAVRSLVVSKRGAIAWKGRTYAARETRLAEAG